MPSASASLAFTILGAANHVASDGNAGQARQALCPAGSRHQAEPRFGQSDRGAGRRDPEVAGERDLQAAAERGAVDGGDQRLVDGVEAATTSASSGGFGRLVHLLDVGAGHEAGAAAGDDDRRPDGPSPPPASPRSGRRGQHATWR